MKRLLGTLLLGAALVLGAVSPASAVVGQREGSGAKIAPTAPNWDPYGDCDDWNASGGHLGMTNGSPSINRYGVSATIRIHSQYFRNCVFSGADIFGAASAWVSLDPRSGDGNGTMILQVGLIRCSYLLWSACGVVSQSPAPLHYFIAYGGCQGALPGPIDKGAAAWGAHDFKIEYDSGSSSYKLYGNPAGQADNLLATISRTHQSISCWIGTWGSNNNPDEATWYGERGDEGDGLGAQGNSDQPADSGTHRLQFTTARYLTSSWANPGWAVTGQSCATNYNYDNQGVLNGVCDLIGSDKMDAWTYDTPN